MPQARKANRREQSNAPEKNTTLNDILLRVVSLQRDKRLSQEYAVQAALPSILLTTTVNPKAKCDVFLPR